MPVSRITRRQFLTGLGAVAAGTCLYTWRIEPTWVEFVRRDLTIENLPAMLAGRTLVQLSDIHIGPQVNDDYLKDVFARVTALRPDIVVNTGDLVTYAGPQTLTQARTLLAGFPRGKLATIATLGNHDYGKNWSEYKVANQVSELLGEAGCLVLRNQLVNVLGLSIAGLDDLWGRRFLPQRILPRLAPGKPAIVLSHNPDTCDRPGWSGYRGWILAGHTHGGQCKPPFLPPPLLPVSNRRYTAGEFDLGNGRRLYINRGVGHLLRVRFNVRPEVTVFTLKPA
ncbi:MAG TPA: metallophosphoesterase [Lacunisphaera sp.]|nr:metallophosphoesterase [Lacunisphaera sp.]